MSVLSHSVAPREKLPSLIDLSALAVNDRDRPRRLAPPSGALIHGLGRQPSRSSRSPRASLAEPAWRAGDGAHQRTGDGRRCHRPPTPSTACVSMGGMVMRFSDRRLHNEYRCCTAPGWHWRGRSPPSLTATGLRLTETTRDAPRNTDGGKRPTSPPTAGTRNRYPTAVTRPGDGFAPWNLVFAPAPTSTTWIPHSAPRCCAGPDRRRDPGRHAARRMAGEPRHRCLARRAEVGDGAAGEGRPRDGGPRHGQARRIGVNGRRRCWCSRTAWRRPNACAPRRRRPSVRPRPSRRRR